MRRAPVRIFVGGFLALLLALAVADVEAWPLSAFRLFSHVRRDVQVSTQVTLVSGAHERPLPFGALDASYSGWVHVVGGLDGVNDAERLAVCRAYLDAARDLGLEGTLAIHRIERDVSARDGDRGLPGTRTLIYTCDGTRMVPA